jgi:hypothetical protein
VTNKGVVALSNAHRHILKYCWLSNIEKKRKTTTTAGTEMNQLFKESNTATVPIEGISKKEYFLPHSKI